MTITNQIAHLRATIAALETQLATLVTLQQTVKRIRVEAVSQMSETSKLHFENAVR